MPATAISGGSLERRLRTDRNRSPSLWSMPVSLTGHRRDWIPTTTSPTTLCATQHSPSARTENATPSPSTLRLACSQHTVGIGSHPVDRERSTTFVIAYHPGLTPQMTDLFPSHLSGNEPCSIRRISKPLHVEHGESQHAPHTRLDPKALLRREGERRNYAVRAPRTTEPPSGQSNDHRARTAERMRRRTAAVDR